MKIIKIKIVNYRLLKEFELDLEKDLSLIIGKNNSGKTSLLSILDKFIGQRSFSSEFNCDDFNIDFQKRLKNLCENALPTDLPFIGINLKLFIAYDEKDNLSNLSKVLMDLDPQNKTVVLSFEYRLHEEDLQRFISDYKAFEIGELAKYLKEDGKAKSDEKEIANTATEKDETISSDTKVKEVTTETISSVIEDKETERDTVSPKISNDEAERNKKVKNLFYTFLRKHQHEYFKPKIKTVLYDIKTEKEDDSIYIDLTDENIKIDKIINFRIISAKREVSNKDSNKTLSLLSSKYYEKREGLKEDSAAIDEFKETLSETDDKLDLVYLDLFRNVIQKVEKFGGVKTGDSIIKIVSTLQHKELLKGNTTVMYDHNSEHSLPEHYNGLGYMNLIGMIFEIEVLLTDFRKDDKENETPADINLLFIEEPEAHTHPQMQYVFIKNIKSILSDASKGNEGTMPFNLQTIITTHSSHIAAESQFDDIKYFSKKDQNEVVAKNLKDLEKEYVKDGEIENFKFLKQYLTLNRAELFFADKAIFIEGDTERILLPAMMRKIDQSVANNALLSQNISIVEVGAYSHIFEKFINFINVKSLIITDIDSGMKVTTKDDKEKDITTEEACEVEHSNASLITNASLKFFFDTKGELSFYKALSFEDKLLKKNKKWLQDKTGSLAIIFQNKQKNKKNEHYYPRSFEDSFFHLNRQFIIDNEAGFKSLKNFKLFKETNSPYLLAEKCVTKKPSFAMEVLLNSKEDSLGNSFSNWEIPSYIKEGLLWLRQN